jgi:hypothetical protein
MTGRADRPPPRRNRLPHRHRHHEDHQIAPSTARQHRRPQPST